MIVNKPTPEELEAFLKGLSDNELLELVVTRAHQDNTVPIEFISKSNASSCGIDNNGYALAIKERASRAKDVFESIGLPQQALLKEDFSIPLNWPYRSTGPSPWFEEQKNGRHATATERFERFVKELPIHELFALGDLVLNGSRRFGLGTYRSEALEQEERVYHSDIPLVYNEIKSRFKSMTEVK